MQRMRFAWIAAVGAVLAAAVAGAATAAHTSSKDVTLNLVAYSTPRPVLTKLIEEFRKTPQGSGVNIRASYGPSSAQGQAVANGLPADGVILNTGNDINDLVDKGLVDKNWDKQSYNGVVWNSVVVFGLRNGNPKKIKGWNDLLKPGVGRRHRQPVHRRHRQVEHPRRLRRAAPPGQDRQAGDRLPAEVLQEQRRVPGLVGIERDEHVPVGEGRRPPHVRERGDQREDPVRHPAADDADRRLHRGGREGRAQGRMERLLALPEDVSGAEDPRRERLPAGEQAGAHRVPAASSRCGPGETTITNKLLGGWRAVDKKWFDPSKSIMQEIEQSLGVEHWKLAPSPAGAGAPGTGRASQGEGLDGSLPAGGFRHDVPARRSSCCRSPPSSGSRPGTGGPGSGTSSPRRRRLRP